MEYGGAHWTVGMGKVGRWRVFLGTHYPRLDDKGRLILPAKFRDDLAAGVVMTKGQDGCIYLFTRAEFAAMTERMAASPLTSGAARNFNRVFFAGATDEVPDKQGRITIPAALRDYAGLVRDCVVIGANTRLEIWEAARWQEYLALQEPQFAALTEEVLPGLI